MKIDVESKPNPNSSTRTFKRICIFLGPLKKGFDVGQRDLLGLDGAFMKGPFPGQILYVVVRLMSYGLLFSMFWNNVSLVILILVYWQKGLDGNNGTYPLAYVVVESENTNSWLWFLTNMGEDLGLQSNSKFTFITDRQKVIFL